MPIAIYRNTNRNTIRNIIATLDPISRFFQVFFARETKAQTPFVTVAIRIAMLVLQRRNTLYSIESNWIGTGAIMSKEMSVEPINKVTETIVTVEQGAEHFAISKSMLWHLVLDGAIASFKMGRARRTSLEAIERWIDSQEG